MTADWSLRLAQIDDVDQLETLIPISVRSLQAQYYTIPQMEAALGPVFGVDRQLIADRTYFVAEAGDRIVACGGWSKREALFGGDSARDTEPGELNPATNPARVRAFFVHPDWARRGIGRAILDACEAAIASAGFHRIELVATLAGEPLYLACGYREIERLQIELPGVPPLPGVRMGKQIKVGS